MEVSRFDYYLPPQLIAQRPARRRDESRLMVVERTSRKISDHVFGDIGQHLRPGDVLVVNNTRVRPARLFGRKAATGAKIEALLVRPCEEHVWEALVRPSRRLRRGTRLFFGDGVWQAVVVDKTTDGLVRIRFDDAVDVESGLERIGCVPLPPYIRRPADDDDRDRYQCVYAKHLGAIAAPTAGLHFTPELLRELEGSGVRSEEITLHVGLGTFQPVSADTVEGHRVHSEHAEVSDATASRLNRAREQGGRVVAVGTTSVRTLETAARCGATSGAIKPYAGDTDLFIYPGYEFRATDALITNFHLPKSTLLMLVAAFAGYDLIRHAYELAVERRYRFYSYGDAMLIL